jgi:hypothetical protein
MKKKIFEKQQIVALFAAMIMICFISCKGKYEHLFFEITPQETSLFFSADGKSVSYGSGFVDAPATFTINTNKGQWNVTADEPWVHVAKKDNTFSVSVDPVGTLPESDMSRLTIVSVKIGETVFDSKLVEQQSALYVSPIERTVVLPVNGGSKTFSVYAGYNTEWDAVSSHPWLNVAKITALSHCLSPPIPELANLLRLQ